MGPEPNIKVKTRIYAGFATIIALSIGLATFSVFQLSTVGGEIATLNALSGNVTRVLSATELLERIRRTEVDSRTDGGKADVSELRALIVQTRELMSEAAGATLSEERRHIYNSIKTGLEAHQDTADTFIEAGQTAAAERAKLFSVGDQLSAAATAMAGSAGAGVADEATKVNTAILLVRIANWRFIATGDASGPALFHAKVDAAHAALAEFDRVANPAEASSAKAVRASLDAYQSAFEAFSAARLKSVGLFDNSLKPQIIDMQQGLARAKETLLSASKITTQQSEQVVSSTSRLQEFLAGLSLAFGVTLAASIARGIVRPLTSMTGAMTKLARGNIDVVVPARDNADEIGEMARAVEVFRSQAIENGRLNAASAYERAAKDRRQSAMDKHTDDFGRSISGVMEVLAASATQMREAAMTVAEGAQRTRETTSGTVSGAHESVQNLSSVAAAVEELAHSINEISRQVAHVTTAVKSAVERATETDSKVAGLSAAADRIGDVVSLINNVASQTNLLALNATIEAARAGEAGRGFAVVAGEVKALATQTAAATEQITGQIVSIRNATIEAVSSVRAVGNAISQVEQVATAIASAVEQQAAATQEITSSVQKVSESTAAAATGMSEVLDIAESTQSNSESSLRTAEEVGRTATTLRKEVADFLTAMSTGSEGERRLYERIPGAGLKASFRVVGGGIVSVPIADISRGGIALAHTVSDVAGTDVEIGLPGGIAVAGRIARAGNGITGISFRQDAASLALIDKVIDMVRSAGQRAAA